MPAISVILPVFNVEKYIEDSIKSICNQSYRDFELILVDDGSRDNSIDIAENILKKTEIAYRIIYQENKGVAAARNIGIDAANGEWVICIDSDDCIHPQTFEILSFFTMNLEVDVIGFDFQRVKYAHDKFPQIRNLYLHQLYSRKELADAFLKRKLELIVPSLLIRNSIYSSGEIRYNESCLFSEDQLFIWNLLLHINSLCFIKNKYYLYVEHKNSIMTSSSCEKILTGYKAFADLDGVLREKKLDLGIDIDFILPRWIIGALHSSSKHLDFIQFKHLTECLNYKCHANKLFAYSDKRISLLAKTLLYSRYLFYRASRIF